MSSEGRAEVRQVVLVDDDMRPYESFLVQAENAGVGVHTCATLQEIDALLSSGQAFDVVVLDWFLGSAENADQARIVLLKVKETRFVPVLVYTDYPEDFGREPPDFPDTCITCVSKHDVSFGRLKEVLDDWYGGSLPARLALAWRSAVAAATERQLYGLASVPDADIVQIFKGVIGEEEQPDLDHAIRSLHRLHGRYVLADDPLRDALGGLLEDVRDAEELTPEGYAELGRALMYYQPTHSRIDLGDIVHWELPTGEQRYGVVITPACNLAQRSTAGVCVLGAREPAAAGIMSKSKIESLRKGQTVSRHLLPFAVPAEDGSGYRDLVINFGESFLFCVNTGDRGRPEPMSAWDEPADALTYDASFVLDGAVTSIGRIGRLDDPYLQDLVQRFATYASRVGLPDTPREIVEWIRKARGDE